jgi:hypothetical protein
MGHTLGGSESKPGAWGVKKPTSNGYERRRDEQKKRGVRSGDEIR